MQTFILGKDAALEDSIDRFQQQLAKIGFSIEEASWLNPVPNVWSVHIRDKECPLCFTNGKGSTKKAALASALGEFFERLSTNYFFADYYLGATIANSDFVHYPDEKWFKLLDNDHLPEGILDSYLSLYFDPEDELRGTDLIDLQSGNEERGICALPFERQSDQNRVYIPVNIIGNLYVSNGMSAGNTKSEARVQALSEIFERYIKNRVIAEAVSLPRIPDAVIARYPTIQKAIAKLEEEGFPILCFDSSLNGQYPVICVVLFNPLNGTCFASFGSHPNFGVAFERTLTELLQGRSLKDLDVFAPPTFDNDEVAEHTNLETHFIDSSGLVSWDMFKEESDYPFVDWDFSGTTEQECVTLIEMFTKEDYEVYIADYEYLGVYACRVLVPGVSDIYPVDDLLLANNNMAAHLRDTILELPNTEWPPEQYLTFLQQLDEEGLDDFARVRELLGIATGADNDWHTLRIGELKALLALAGGDLEQAEIWVDWTIEFNQSVFSFERNNFYRCLKTLLELVNVEDEPDLEQYYDAFCKMYGADTVDTAWAHVNQDDRFYHLFAIDPDMRQLPEHQALLTAYGKIQRAKVDSDDYPDVVDE
jgi:ribosomal protein S12 methylthiotransferase accessory factor